MKLTTLIPKAMCTIWLGCAVNAPGQGWQPVGSSGPWSRIACSADGTKVLAVGEYPVFRCANGIYGSTNSGATWLSIGTDAGVDVAGSVDGTVWLVADSYCGDLLFTNPASWPLVRTAVNTSSSLVALSSDGTRLVAAGLIYGIFGSTDAGTSWQPLLANVTVSSLACSADGATLVAGSLSNVVYTSSDFGVTWLTNAVDGQWMGPWNAVACSADGSRLFAASADGIFVSTNAGLAWTQIHAADSFQSIAISADTTQIAAAVKAGLIYTSTNSGEAWTLSGLGDLSALGNTNDIVTCVAMSADGAKMFAAPQGGSIYTNQFTPAPLLKAAPSGTNLNFLWPFPSKDFVLQQSLSPLTNIWRDVPVSPVVNYQTLQNLASISAPTQAVFFRLAAFQTLQGSFRDLDFDSGSVLQLRGDPYNRIFFGSAFPGWTGYSGTVRATDAIYNNLVFASAAIGLQTNSAGVFDGKYYASIQAGPALGGGSPPPAVTSYLSQTALIPSGARSLLFNASGSNYVVSLNGQSLNPTSLGGNLYGADMTRFAGTSAELRFTVLTNSPPRSALNSLYLDSISFSTRPVP